MKKSYLKSKMCVELRNGIRYLVVDDVLLNKNGFVMIKNYNEKLENENEIGYDIVKVYKYNNNFYDFTNDLGVSWFTFEFDFERNSDYQLLWKRKQTLELTLDEIAEKFDIHVSQLKIKE